MCVGIPGEVLKVDGNEARAVFWGTEKWVRIDELRLTVGRATPVNPEQLELTIETVASDMPALPTNVTEGILLEVVCDYLDNIRVSGHSVADHECDATAIRSTEQSSLSAEPGGDR